MQPRNDHLSSFSPRNGYLAPKDCSRYCSNTTKKGRGLDPKFQPREVEKVGNQLPKAHGKGKDVFGCFFLGVTSGFFVKFSCSNFSKCSFSYFLFDFMVAILRQ